MTVKGKWFTNLNHHRLIAILEVIERRDTHLQAKSWYTSKRLPIPFNCMVNDNDPHPFIETAGRYETEKDCKNFLSYSSEKQKIIGNRIIEKWNNEYLSKSKKCGVFIITKPIFLNLNNPPIFSDEAMYTIFKKKINTRTPKILTNEEFKQVAKIAQINFMQPG